MRGGIYEICRSDGAATATRAGICGMMIRRKIVIWYVISTGVVLSILGLLKLISAFGHAHVLEMPDPVIGLTVKHTMIGVGCLEILVAIACFSIKRIERRLGLIAWISTNFLIYRIGLWLIDWPSPCHCMGTITDSLHIPVGVADTVMKCVLLFMLTGSYGALYLCKSSKLGCGPDDTQTTVSVG